MDDRPNDSLATDDHGERVEASPRQRRLARAAIAAGISGLRPVVTQSSEGLTLVVLGRRDRGTDLHAERPGGTRPSPARPAVVPERPRPIPAAVSDAIANAAEAFTLPPGAVGVAVGIFDRIVSLDAFDEPEALRAAWPRLLTDAVRAWLEHRRSIDSGEAPLPGRRVPDEGATARLLRRASVALADADVRSGDDESMDVRIAGERVEGSARVTGGRTIRLVIIRPERPEGPDGLVP